MEITTVTQKVKSPYGYRVPFVVAYLFTPKGVRAFAGTENSIVEHCHNMPTCHGIVHTYNKEQSKELSVIADAFRVENENPFDAYLFKNFTHSDSLISKGIIRTKWGLFGKDICRWKPNNMTDIIGRSYIPGFAMVKTDNSRWPLPKEKRVKTAIVHMNDRNEITYIIQTFRKLPSKYLAGCFRPPFSNPKAFHVPLKQ